MADMTPTIPVLPQIQLWESSGSWLQVGKVETTSTLPMQSCQKHLSKVWRNWSHAIVTWVWALVLTAVNHPTPATGAQIHVTKSNVTHLGESWRIVICGLRPPLLPQIDFSMSEWTSLKLYLLVRKSPSQWFQSLVISGECPGELCHNKTGLNIFVFSYYTNTCLAPSLLPFNFNSIAL